MNSSLQCLSNTFELSKYFTSMKFMEDINVDNPLGSGGKLAEAYGRLLHEMWDLEGSVVRPSTFKKILG